MLNKTHLTERYQNILRATIQHYIATAEPVGSKTLLEEYKFRISSATIRNALGSLEKAGLLYQPHISAGRIPSDSGYRIYVDQLLTFNANKKEKIDQSLQQQLTSQGWSLETLLQRATQILASLSGYIALITFPQTTTIQLRHLQLVQVSPGQVMIIIVTDAYQTHSILMDLPQNAELETPISPEDFEEELQILSNFLNSQLKGKNLSELSTLNWQEMDQKFTSYTDFLKILLKKLEPLLQSSAPMVIHGVSEVIRQPEFSQLEQVQMLLRLLEQEQDQLFPLIFELPDRDHLAKSVSIRIGAENPLASMRPCTLVSALYHQGDVPVGSVGIIGPTRMLYEQTIPLVESTANYLSEALS